jgi:Leucine-rich repeat (LRR) protein
VTGFSLPVDCNYIGAISNGYTTLKANASIGNENIVEIFALGNTAIKYLPIDLASTFPKLQGIDYQSCGISEHSYRSLKNLSTLRLLFLDSNSISKLDGEVF